MADDLHYSRPDAKRKYDDPSPPPSRRPTGFSAPITASDSGGATAYNSVPPPAVAVDGIQLAKQRAQEIAARLFSDAEAKRPRVENGDELGDKGYGAGIADLPQKPMVQQIPSLAPQSSFPSYGYPGSNKKIEIPNGRVGVIIGKMGETIKYLQLQSGAKIQVTRDMDADPNSLTRIVELIGTPEQISKAEQLVNDVLTEAETGGSGTVSARKAGSEQFSMKIPNNKVGLIIGKGGETIKSMQAKSGARIQVVPLHPPPGETLTERTLFIDGTQEQIESAKVLVNEVISENRARNPTAGGYPSQGYRPPHQQAWGPPPMQQPGYGYMQPGAYPGAPPPYNVPQQAYGAYPPPASGGFSSGWDQTTNQSTQPTAPGGGGYDYYNQQQHTQQQTAGGSTAPDGVNYGYGQPSSYTSQGSYGDSSYSQTATAQQPGYGYAVTPQPGYSQPVSNPSGYDQQGYGPTAGYGSASNPPQDGSAPSYGAQSGANQTPPAQPVPGQQPPTQQGYSNQPPVTSSAGYATQSVPPTGYATSPYGTTQAQTAYGQAAPPGQSNYGQPPQAQKPPAQPVYGQGQPPVASQGGYMQPAPTATGYGQAPQSQSGYAQDSSHLPPSSYGQQTYGAPPSQPGYVQQKAYPDSYGSGAYSQPPTYSSDGAGHPSYDAPVAAPAAPAGAPKASPS